MNSIIANEHNKKKCQKFTPINEVNDMLDLAGYTHGLLGKKFWNIRLDQEILSSKLSNDIS